MEEFKLKITLLGLRDTQNGKEVFGIPFTKQELADTKDASVSPKRKIALDKEDLMYFHELANDMLGNSSFDGESTKVEYYEGNIILSGSQVKYEELNEEQMNEFANDLLYPYLESKYA